jgi:hypothetical protein
LSCSSCSTLFWSSSFSSCNRRIVEAMRS